MTDTILNLTQFIASICALLFFVLILIGLVVFAGYVILAVIFNIALAFKDKKR